MKNKNVYIIAGPNGAGKTTFAKRFYKPLLDSWMFFDNAGDIPRLIAEEKDGKILIIDKDLYDAVTRGAL